MRQHVTDRSRGTEAGPVPLHRRIQIQPPGLDEAQGAHGREWLAHRVGLGHAAGFPRPAPCRVRVTTPQVNHPPAVVPCREGSAGARLRAENLGEAVAHRAEPRISMSLNFHAAIMALSSASRSGSAPGSGRLTLIWSLAGGPAFPATR